MGAEETGAPFVDAEVAAMVRRGILDIEREGEAFDRALLNLEGQADPTLRKAVTFDFARNFPGLRALGLLLGFPESEQQRLLATLGLDPRQRQGVEKRLTRIHGQDRVFRSLCAVLPGSFLPPETPAWRAYRQWLARLLDKTLRETWTPPRYQVEDQARKGPKDTGQAETHADPIGPVIEDLVGEKSEIRLVLVVGGPDTGKSAFARMLASALSADEGAWPVFVPLRQLDPKRALLDEIGRLLDSDGFPSLGPALLRTPKPVLILDGFGDGTLASRTSMAAFFDQARDLLRAQGPEGLRILLTGRDTLFSPERVSIPEGSRVYRLLPLASPQSQRPVLSRPGSTPRVFVSYTAEDLVEHAKVVVGAVRRLEWVPIDHRDWTAVGLPSLEWCREKVRSCDVLVVLVAHRYGWVPSVGEGGDGERSVVWLEVEEARASGKTVLPFLVDEDAPWSPKLMEVLKNPVAGQRLAQLRSILSQTIHATFSTPESLAVPAYQALAEWEKARAARPTSGEDTPGEDTPTDTITAYRRKVEADHRDMELLGLGDQLHVRLPISDAYVTLRATLPMAMERMADMGRYDGRDLECHAETLLRDIPLPEVFRKASERGLSGVVLIGDPGSGKTTAAKHIAWRCADPAQGPTTLGLPEGLIPAFLRLRRLRPDHVEGGMMGFLCEELRSRHLTDFEDQVGTLCKKARFLWILDGLDEVADPKLRARVSHWIDDTAHERKEDRFLVTCRYAGYHDDAVLGSAFLRMDVQPLDEGQRADFVSRWFRAVERAVLGAAPEADSRAAERASALTKLLESGDFRVKAGLSALVANPLLLSILCVVYRKELDLPRRRSELYARCVDVLLHHWRTAKGMEGLALGSARAVLQPLAWWMHSEPNRAEAEAEPLSELAEPLLASMGKDAPAATGREFLDRACDQSGILVRPSPGRYAFLHLSFQEYLAAAHASTRPKLAMDLADRFGESWWKEATLLALGQGSGDFSEAFFRKVLAKKGDLDSSFLGLCLEDALLSPAAPFVDALRAMPARQAMLLRLLSGRKDPEILGAARKLARGAAPEVAGAARELLMRAGEELPVDNEVFHEESGIVLVRIPAGVFLMGSSVEEQAWAAKQGASRDWVKNEGPQHEVTITRDFWMGKHPVTNEQYGRFLAENPDHRKPEKWNESRFNQPRQPVVGVSWHDAMDFCRWMGARLPREAEWEYACRAATTTRFWSGDEETDLNRVGWYGKNSGGSTKPVGEKPANPWGLHDMHGNVWEWCADGLAPYKERAESVDPQEEPADLGGAVRVVRGGGWVGGPVWCRAAYRGGFVPGFRWRDLGFRVVRAPSPSRH